MRSEDERMAMTEVLRITKEFQYFLRGLFDVTFKGGKNFYIWMTFLTIMMLIGLGSYITQMRAGLVVTNMREQVSWGFYISNFTFMVGVAAAAVLLVIPAYLYHFKAIKKIVVFGELLAITAVLMAILFIFVDFGRPDRFWHIIPFIGTPNFPSSILAWDMVVLNGYLFLNLFIVVYVGSCKYFGKEPNKLLVIPLILLSIPWAIGVHTVTAFVYNGLTTRPFWNASILAPRFLASAFCSGPALMIIIFQILRKVMNFEIRDRAIFKLAEIIAYAMAINLFLMVAEIYKDYYSPTMHISSMRYLYQGLHGHNNLVPWIWTAMLFNTVGFLLFIIPWTRKNFVTLNTGCVLIFIGIWIEKGMGLIIPGFIPDTMGEIYEYMPTALEVMIFVGICGFGAMTYTLLVRSAVAVDTGKLRHPEAPPIQQEVEEGPVAKDIMSKKVISVPPDTTVEAIGRILSDNRISGVPVVDEHNRIIGVVSESDIIIYEIYQEPHLVDRLKNVIHPEAQKMEAKPGGIASEIMTVPAITAREETPLRELIQSTIEKNIKRIIIADDEGHPVGVVSRIDIVKALEHI
jgi:molybdopterin-containing oxidoreductase family membrane subunit